MPQDVAGMVVAKQLVRRSLSVGANYRSACRGRSRAEFLSKLGIVLEEIDESAHWLEVIIEAEMLPKTKVADLLQEAKELTAIFSAAVKTTKNLTALRTPNPTKRGATS